MPVNGAITIAATIREPMSPVERSYTLTAYIPLDSKTAIADGQLKWDEFKWAVETQFDLAKTRLGA